MPEPDKREEEVDVVFRLRPVKADFGPLRSRTNRLLKYALRACGFRCVTVQDVPRDSTNASKE